METVIQILHVVKSPKTALVLIFFSGALLFAPLEKIGLRTPQFTDEYQTHILMVFLFAASILVLELGVILLKILKMPFQANARRKWLDKTFFSLNLNELCVLWAMTQTGMKTIKADYANPIMISLRQKGCLGLMPGPQNWGEVHHYMPDSLYERIRDQGYDRFPVDFKNSVRFEDEVREIVHASTS